jgi:hypothetical protein
MHRIPSTIIKDEDAADADDDDINDGDNNLGEIIGD